MKLILRIISIIILLGFFNQYSVAANNISPKQMGFILEMEKKHGFESEDLKKLFIQAKVSETILKAISRPAEKSKPWYKYRKIFVTNKRINKGIKFIKENYTQLKKAEKHFGVPIEIITAIIGVETFYGRITGSYRVIDALNTLAFNYPKRAKFFRKELEHFLLLAREQGFNPLSLKGSYAGAMGIAQFIPSSYRAYAYDFDDDDIIDIWKNNTDAIGSIGNYFAKHGWQSGRPIVEKVSVTGGDYKEFLKGDLTPNKNIGELRDGGVITDKKIKPDAKLKLIEYKLKNSNEYWLAYKNFYVISRYNHSKLYAMAVYQLAMKIKQNMDDI